MYCATLKYCTVQCSLGLKLFEVLSHQNTQWTWTNNFYSTFKVKSSSLDMWRSWMAQNIYNWYNWTFCVQLLHAKMGIIQFLIISFNHWRDIFFSGRVVCLRIQMTFILLVSLLPENPEKRHQILTASLLKIF